MVPSMLAPQMLLDEASCKVLTHLPSAAPHVCADPVAVALDAAAGWEAPKGRSKYGERAVPGLVLIIARLALLETAYLTMCHVKDCPQTCVRLRRPHGGGADHGPAQLQGRGRPLGPHRLAAGRLVSTAAALSFAKGWQSIARNAQCRHEGSGRAWQVSYASCFCHRLPIIAGPPTAAAGMCRPARPRCGTFRRPRAPPRCAASRRPRQGGLCSLSNHAQPCACYDGRTAMLGAASVVFIVEAASVAHQAACLVCHQPIRTASSLRRAPASLTP